MSTHTPTLADVRRKAKVLGATVHDMGSDYNIEAPEGFTWACEPGLHELVMTLWDDETWGDGKAYADALERMEYGIEKETP